MTASTNGTDTRDLWGGWFRTEAPDNGLFVISEPLHAEDVKSFLVLGGERAVLIDTGMGVADIGELVRQLTTLPVTVVVSHAHWDHVGGNRHFDDLRAPELSQPRLRQGWTDERMARALAPGELRGPLPDGFDPDHAGIPGMTTIGTVTPGETLDLGGRQLEVIAAPGHCPDLIVLLDAENGILFGTDAVYADALYAQSDESDVDAYQETLDRLADLAPNLNVVYGSHGPSAFSPSLLPEMARAMRSVRAGREPDEHRDGFAGHVFEGFSIIVPDGDSEAED